MSTRIHLCGAVGVTVDGERRERRLPGRQGVLLLAFLVCNRRRPFERDALMEVLWPRERPRAAGAALRALLSKLRTTLGPEAVVGRERIHLRLEPDAWIDVEAADEALHRAEGAVASQDWGEAWGAARVAAMVSERGFLVGHDHPWVDEQRREFDRMLERARRCIVACGLALGDRELVAAERAARWLAECRPLDESAVGLQMRVHAAAGDPAAALGAFEGLRLRLRDELGTAPGAELRALHRRLLA
ncbi:MAG: BTAD domain-containing putative transcriptional regulator [Thermoleophilia bacterium]